jgi:hypothetical protein
VIPRLELLKKTMNRRLDAVGEQAITCSAHLHRVRALICRFRGVSRKKGRWEAKVMVNRKWAYRELFNSEEAAGGRFSSWQGCTSHQHQQNALCTSGSLPATDSMKGRSSKFIKTVTS